MKDKVTKTHYIKKDIKYDRVTAILNYFTNPGLIAWRDKVGVAQAKQTMKTAGGIGTRVHGLIYKHYINGRFSLTPNDGVSTRNCMKAYMDWWKAYNPKTLSMERTLYSEELGIAGTYDKELPDTLLDVKTSAKIRPEHWLQLAIYNYMGVFQKEKLAVLRLDKWTADYEYVVIDYDVKLVECFKGLLQYYRFITKEGT